MGRDCAALASKYMLPAKVTKVNTLGHGRVKPPVNLSPKVHDAAGSTTKMTFAEPRRNHGIDKARFTFTPPDAVDIISESEAGF